MKSILKRLELVILSLGRRLGVTHPHTWTVAALLVVILLLMGLLALQHMSLLSAEFSHFLAKSFQFFIGVVLTGLIVGVLSNRLSERMREMASDDLRSAIIQSGLTNLFLPEKDGSDDRRTRLTCEQIRKMEGEVCLLAIAATSYLPRRDTMTMLSSAFIDRLREKHIQLRLILLNPFSQAAKFRFAREAAIDVEAVADRRSPTTDGRFEESLFYRDIDDTLSKVAELRRDGVQIECRLTNFDPIISTMISKESVYVDVLSLGRREEVPESAKQRVTLPVLEFSNDSRSYTVARSHFEFHWKYGITPDEFECYQSQLRERFFAPSFTGYRLISQHDSWISVDPVVGCNGGCRYCVLQTTFGNHTDPTEYTAPDLIGDRLRESRFYHDDAVICLFNYTDALLSVNRQRLLAALSAMKERGCENWVCIPTKHHCDKAFVRKVLNSYDKKRLVFLISLSGMPARYEPSVDPERLANTMKMLKDLDIPVIHYWRPVTKHNCGTGQIRSMLEKVAGCADSSVVSGLKASRALHWHYLNNGLITSDLKEPRDRGDYLPVSFMDNLRGVLEEQAKAHPVFLHTSCAVSKIRQSPDYNGTMFSKHICSLHKTGASFCTREQEALCRPVLNNQGRDSDDEGCRQIVRDVLPHVSVSIKGHTIELLDPVCQEDVIHLIHRTRRPVKARSILHTNQYVGSILSGDSR